MTQDEDDTTPTPTPAPKPRSFWRNFWQLDVPGIVVLVGCAVATSVEFTRAGDGVWRAWVYTFEWPLIGLFAIWVWYRYRIRDGIRRTPKPRTRDAQTEDDPVDPALSRWQEYQRKIRENATPDDKPAGD